MKIKIDRRIISNKSKPLVVAEIGINHFGSLTKAKKIVDKIKSTGAEAVKVQIHIPEEEMSIEAKSIKPGNSNLSIYKVIEKNSLSLDDELKLKKYIEKKKLIYIATPFSFKAAKWLNENNIKIFKVGSGECNNLPLIKYICSFKKPMIVSTGMNSIESVRKTVKILNNHKIKHVLMHCVNLYPTPYKISRINRIRQLKNIFKKSLVGYSDHTIGTHLSKIAITLGATIIEKHFTENKKIYGPDISCSMDKEDLKKILEFINIYHLSIRNNKNILKEENITRKFAFHSVVSKKLIYKGEKFSKNNLTVKRPGTGYFPAANLEKLYNKIAKRNIFANKLLQKKDVY
tara:strand:+ start:309 stop:1343 length:1035 start_codon:yes stop_codon:yes gene_type:complete